MSPEDEDISFVSFTNIDVVIYIVVRIFLIIVKNKLNVETFIDFKPVPMNVIYARSCNIQTTILE